MNQQIRQNQANDISSIFYSRLPDRPYTSDNLDFGLKIQVKNRAIKNRFIQPNGPSIKNWLCYDIDNPHFLDNLNSVHSIPTPNFIIENPKNFHCHAIYGLETGVCISEAGSYKSMRFLSNIEDTLLQQLKADTHYNGVLIKTPNNTNWNTHTIRKDLWTLNELGDYCDFSLLKNTSSFNINQGRNCFLFDVGRKYAYKLMRDNSKAIEQSLFLKLVYDHIEQKNHTFILPLPEIEVLNISKSITKWTLKRYLKRVGMSMEDYIKKTHTPHIQSLRGKRNTSYQQSVKGKKGAAANTSHQQSLKGKANTSEQQSIKGTLGGIRSGQSRRINSAEELKPWEQLNISRRSYYYGKKNNLI